MHGPQLSSSLQLRDFHLTSWLIGLGDTCRTPGMRAHSLRVGCLPDQQLACSFFATGNNRFVCIFWDSSAHRGAFLLWLLQRWHSASWEAPRYQSQQVHIIHWEAWHWVQIFTQARSPTRAWESTQQLSNKVYHPLSFSSSSSSLPKTPDWHQIAGGNRTSVNKPTWRGNYLEVWSLANVPDPVCLTQRFTSNHLVPPDAGGHEPAAIYTVAYNSGGTVVHSRQDWVKKKLQVSSQQLNSLSDFVWKCIFSNHENSEAVLLQHFKFQEAAQYFNGPCGRFYRGPPRAHSCGIFE